MAKMKRENWGYNLDIIILQSPHYQMWFLYLSGQIPHAWYENFHLRLIFFSSTIRLWVIEGTGNIAIAAAVVRIIEKIR